MQRCCGAAWGGGRVAVEREDLIQRGLEGDKAGVDEGAAVEGQTRGQGSVGVVAQSLRVAHGDEEQVQRPGFEGAGLKAAFTHQAVVEPTELRGGASSAVGQPRGENGRSGLITTPSSTGNSGRATPSLRFRLPPPQAES